VRPSPFHARTAEANLANAWTVRNNMTLATQFEDAPAEASAARFAAVLGDISWRWRATFRGGEQRAFLARVFTRELGMLAPGAALKTLWLDDEGGVRGAGALARLSEDELLLVSAASDKDWIDAAAGLFGVDVRARDAEGGVALIGPYAPRILAAAGLPCDLPLLAFSPVRWSGIDVTLTRFGEHDGYEIWCQADDALLVWDRLVRAGVPFALRLAGLRALDTLDVERGVPRPHRDFVPANSLQQGDPLPRCLGLEKLIDFDQTEFNGRRALLATARRRIPTLVGVALESEVPAPHAPITRLGRVVGRTLSSFYSPSLRRAIALARMEPPASQPGTGVSVTVATAANGAAAKSVASTVMALPFLPPPEPASG
jgi:aminomethyltransferase